MEGIDAITLLKQDHKKVKGLFRDFEKAKLNAGKAQQIAQEIMEELVVHAQIEEKIFYPAVREAVEDAHDILAESLQEHHFVKISITELQGMSAEQELFHAKMMVLIENVRHHIEEEEGELFPKVREKLGRSVLQQIGGAMEQMKQTASREPMPEAIDEKGTALTALLESEPPGEIQEILHGGKDR